MRNFVRFLLGKLWAIVVILVGTWIPWVVNLFVKDSFKQTVKALAGRDEVSAGAYQLLGVAASNPVSACLLTLFLIVTGAAIYSAVEVKRGKHPPQTYTTPNQATPIIGSKQANTIERMQPTRAMVEIPADAPDLFIDYDRNGHNEYLIFTLTQGKPAVIRKLDSMISSQRFQGVYGIQTIPMTLPLVHVGKELRCEAITTESRTIKTLNDIIRSGSEQAIDCIVVDFDDPEGQEYSRTFFLTGTENGSITVRPGPISRRGKVELPEPTSENILDLREQLRLAATWQTEHDSFEKYRRLSDGLQAEVNRLNWKLQVWPQAAVVNSLAEEIARLRRKLGDLLLMAEQPEYKQFLACAEQPLQPVVLDAGDENLKTFIWRFQKDFRELRSVIHDHYLDIKQPMVDGALASDISNADLGVMMDVTVAAFKDHAAKILEPSTKATTS